MDEDGIRKLLQAMVDKSGGIRPGARALGLSAAYLSDILANRRNVSMRVAGRLGYRRIDKTIVKFVKEK